MTASPAIIKSAPGIKRDGTEFDSNNYSDGQWCRFQRGLPRKIGGYQAATSTLPEKVYGIDSFATDGSQYIHNGSQSKLTQIILNAQGIYTGFNDRTPAGFVADINNVWQMDVMSDASGSPISFLIAHAAPNLADISNIAVAPIYYGHVNDPAVLVDTGMDHQSGGVAVVGPYLFMYGNYGRISWSKPNDPLTIDNEAWPASTKVLRALSLRGGSGGPSALFWCQEELVRATFDVTTIWAFDTIAEISVLSSRGVIEYDGIYYWAAVDRFMVFNGVVQELPNAINVNWFYDNLNYNARQKVFAIKIPRWGEIWWCYPRGTATECTHAVIYNVRERTWYDTQLPGSGRSDGVFAKTYIKPFMVDVDLTATPGYTLWQHETGVDAINGSVITAIRSSFETSNMTLLTGQQPIDKSLRVSRVEPDFVQVGDMSLTVTGKTNARSPDIVSDPVVFPDVAANASEQTAMFKEVRRLMRFKFESNTVGGDYQMGQCIGTLEPADGRVTQ